MKILVHKDDKNPQAAHPVHKANDDGRPICGNVILPADWTLRNGKAKDVSCRACMRAA